MRRPARLRRARSVVAAAILSAVAANATDARADAKLECIAASEEAQRLRNAGRLTEAREQLAACSRAECPRLIQQDCTAWMAEVLDALPTVVPAAKDRAGRDVLAAKVLIDGKVVAEALDGKALSVDPGVHRFRFETEGAPPVEEQVVVRPGEKNRVLTVTFATGDESKPPSDVPSRGGSRPVAAYVLGGVGVAALAAALWVNLDASADARELRETCAPRCAQGDVDDIRTRYVIAGVTAGVGAAALVAGIVLLLTHDGSSASRSAARPFAIVAATSSKTGATLGFRFR